MPFDAADLPPTVANRRPDANCKGVPNCTVSEMATAAGIDRAALVALMVHHGYLDLAFYGGTQRRHLVSDRAIAGGLGRNVDASRVRIAAEGMNRRAAFPVFYVDVVPDILWTLDHAGIVETARQQGGKKARLGWLLEHHGYLPTAEVARISGYTERGVEKVRLRLAGVGSGAVRPRSLALQAMLEEVSGSSSPRM